MAQSLMDLIHQAGFRGDAATTMYGIVMAESGGNANAHNGNAGTGDNSYGLAQINMLGSMGPARMQQYGLKSYDDLYDPLTNLKVAYALSGGGRDFSPWTTYTRGTYTQYLGDTSGHVTAGEKQTLLTGGAVPGGDPTKHTAADYKNALNSGLGDLLTSIPELKKLLDNAIATNQSTADFEDAVQSSSWYRTHNQSTRELVALQYSDPAEYKARLATQQQQIEQMAGKLGLALGPARLAAMVKQSLMEGWSQQTLINNLGKTFFNPNNPNQALTGDIASAYQQMKQVYTQYGVPVSDATLRNNALRIAEGMTSIDSYKASVVNAAKSMYPSLSQQLDQGLTVQDIAAPFTQTMAQLLEVSPDSLSLQTPLVKQALQGTPGKDGTLTQMPLYQFEQQVRKDPRWQYTDNAKQSMATLALHLGKDFGFA